MSTRRFALLVGLLAGVATAFRCIGLAAPWGADNLGTAGYARRPLAIAVMDAATLDDRLRAPRWDVPGGDGRTYVVPSVTPSCFVLPRIHERQFPDLVARLRSAYPVHHDGVFDVFALR